MDELLFPTLPFPIKYMTGTLYVEWINRLATGNQRPQQNSTSSAYPYCLQEGEKTVLRGARGKTARRQRTADMGKGTRAVGIYRVNKWANAKCFALALREGEIERSFRSPCLPGKGQTLAFTQHIWGKIMFRLNWTCIRTVYSQTRIRSTTCLRLIESDIQLPNCVW